MPTSDILDDVLDDMDAGKFDPSAQTEQVNPIFDSVADDIESEISLDRRATILKAQDADPRKYQEYQGLSEKFDLPTDLVQRNYDDLKAQEKSYDIQKLLDENGEIANWYSQGDNAAAIEVDELRELSGLSWLGASAWEAGLSGKRTLDLGNLRFKQLMGIASDDDILEAENLSMSGSHGRTYGADGWLEQGWVAAAEQVPMMFNSFVGSLEGGGAGALSGAALALLVGQAGPQVAAPEEVLTIPGAAATGYRIGSVAGQWQAAFRVEAGLAYDELRSIKDENGKALDDDVARVAAIVAGATSGALETLGFREVSKVIPGADRALGMVGKDGVKAALARPTVRAAFKDFAKNIFSAGVTEISTEVLQEAIVMFSGEVAKATENANGGEFDMSSPEVWEKRLTDIMEQTAKAMTIMGPVTSSTRLGADIRSARKAKSERAIIEALNDHSEGSQLKQRLPDKAREAVEAITANGPVSHVYINSNAIREFFQDDTETARFAKEAGIASEMLEALQTGRDIEVPVSSYYSSIAGTEIGRALMGQTRLTQDAMTSDDAEAFNEAWAAAQEELMSTYDAQVADRNAALEGEETVFSDVKGRAMDAGIVPDQAEQYGKLYSTFFRVMSERTGVDAGALYNRYGFEIRRVLPEELQYKEKDNLNFDLSAIRSGKVPELQSRIQKAQGPSVLEAIRQAGGVRDPGGELRAMGVPESLIVPEKNFIGSLIGGDSSHKWKHPVELVSSLWQDGYFSEFGENRPDQEALFAAIQEELAGNPSYSAAFDQDRKSPDILRAEALVEFAQLLDELGLDPNSMTDDEIRAELDRVATEDADMAAYFQAVSDKKNAAFESWFGDSKVVDENGQPDVVYHGTGSTANFEAFDPSFTGKGNDQLGSGFYFSTEPATASAYTSKVLDTATPKLGGDDSPGIIPAYLSIQNPIILKGSSATMNSINISEAQARSIIEMAPDLMDPEESPIGNWHDIWSSGGVAEWMVDDVAKNYAGPNLISLENDFFRGAASQFRRAITDVLGYDGVRQDFDNGETHWVAFYPEQIKSAYNSGAFDPSDPRILMQETPKKKKGSIQFEDKKTVVNLFKSADLSTFLHESGHFFLEVMRDVALDSDNQQILDDWAKIAKYLEIGSEGQITTEAHEKWARSFEAYLFEGKSPSDEISGMMARFRSWLLFVYKSIKDLGAPINDEVKGVMDRMLATDEEIASARTSPEFRPAFNSAEEAGMTAKQWSEYTDKAGKAVDRARRELDAKLMSELARETTSEWKRSRKEILEKVKQEYARMPVYQAMEFLRTGKSDVVPTGKERVTLSREGIVDILGEGGPMSLPKTVPPLYSKSGGVHPDVVASLFGFKSGHEMLARMASVRPIKKAIAEETEARMRAKYGDLMGDAVARAREVDAAIANDSTGDLLQAELEVLMRKGFVNTSINKSRAQDMARQAIRGKTIREAMRMKLYANANAKAASDTEQAILKGDWKAAVEAKQRQLLNHYMMLEARQAEKDTEAAVKYLNKFAGKKPPKGIPAEYLDQIEVVLSRFDLRKSTTMKASQRKASLASWINDQEAQGNIVQIPDVIRDDAFRKPYREMSVDDLMAVRDAVKSIEHIGRRWGKLWASKKQREFEEVRDAVVSRIEVSQDKRKKSKMRNPTKGEKLLSTMKSLEASMLKIEQVVDWMDAGDHNGPVRQYLWQPIADAEVRENDMRADYAKKLADIFDKLEKPRLSERITVDAVDQTFTRSEIMAVALNMGNASNLDKMMRGEAWTASHLSAITSHLNEAEWVAVQEVWDAVEGLWPEIAALQERLSGVKPPKIERRPVQTPYGVLPGGYYPVVYDPNRDDTAKDRAEERADKMFENTYLRPETMHGFTKERAQAYARPLLYDIDGAGRHIMAVIHDLTHREAIRDAYKLITDGEVRATIQARYGREIYDQFVPWLQSIAHDGFSNDGLASWENLFRKARLNSSIMAMGYRFSTIVTQLAGIGSAMEIISPKHYAASMKDFIQNPAGMSRIVNELSGEMRHRNTQLDRDVRDTLRNVSGKSDLLNNVRKFAFTGIGIMDRVVTVPGWMAAYTQHLEKHPGDIDGAKAFADKAIRLTQGSGGPKDLAAVSRNNEAMRLLTMFYSYFSALYNRQRTLGRDVARAVKNRDMTNFPELLARSFFMIVFPAIISELIVGRGPEEDEDPAAWAARKVALYPLMTAPILRDVISAKESGYGYDYTPAARAWEVVFGKPIDTVMNTAEGELDARKTTKNIIDVTGYATGLPLGQLSSTVNNVWLGIEEDDLSLRDFVLNRPKD